MPFRLITPSRKWQDITHMVTLPVASGRVLFQRDEHERTIALDGLVFPEAGGGTLFKLPRELGWPVFVEHKQIQGLTVGIQVTPPGNVQAYYWAAATPIRGRLTYSIEGVA